MTDESVYETYISAWNETDPTRRIALLGSCLTEDAFVTYPIFETSGYDGVADQIGQAQDRMPGLRFSRVSGIESHHGWLRVAWRARLSDGSTVVDGLDLAELGPGGRFKRVIGFHDPLPRLGREA